MKYLVLLLFGLSITFADVDEFTKGNNLFARSVYEKISKTENGNFLVSPFSAETILAFAHSGAKGESAEEIRSALHLPNDKDKIESALKSLIPRIKGNANYTLHTANKMYVKENFPIKEDFKTAANLVYSADIEQIEFEKSVEAANLMNKWVEKHTNNKIKNLIDSNDLDQLTRAVLINALYFKANWSRPFHLPYTEKRRFYKTATDTVEVDTLLHYYKFFNFYEDPTLKAQILELPFEGGEACMVVVLPNEKDGLANLEKNLDKVFETQHLLEYKLLNIALPKFKIESSIDFKQILQKLGVDRVFNETEADLSGISGKKGDLYINKVAQKTFIDVNEKGVEAAAATFAIILVPHSGYLDIPKNFNADHPFIFYIKVKDLILFVGRVTDPSKY